MTNPVLEITEDHDWNSDMLDRVASERMRQQEKWGSQTHTIDRYNTILVEEVGEVSRAICAINFGKYENDIDYRNALRHLSEELAQVAAVAVAMMTGIEVVLTSDLGG